MAPTIEFRSAIVGRTGDGRVVIALMDGEPAGCIALLICTPDCARALEADIGSVLNAPAPP